MAGAFQNDAFQLDAFQADAGGGSVSLSLAATEGADVAAASVGLALSLNLSATEGADTASAAVGLALSMSLSAVEGADIASASVGLALTASLAATEGADVLAATASVGSATSDLSLAVTEGADTFGASASFQAETSGAGANTYTLAPKTREQWEAEREAARVQDAPAFSEREQAPAAEQPKRQRTPQIPLPLLFQGPKQPTTLPAEAPAAIVLPVPPVQVVADFTVTAEEAAAIATLLTARVNAYRRASTGNPTPIHWAA